MRSVILVTILLLLCASNGVLGVAEFVANCPLSHIAPDDPIVFPGQYGASHSHQFYSSVITDACTKLNDLLTHNTTCNVRQDLSAYWHPTVYYNGVPLTEYDEIKFYYQSQHTNPKSVIPFPLGLRVVAGDSKATEEQDEVHWSCLNENMSYHTIPLCGQTNPDSGLELFVNFPDCWDGVNLDSPNHASHMAYSNAGLCPDTHPNPVPTLQFKLQFAHLGGPGTTISSDPSDTTDHGITLHADFFNGWEREAIALRVRNCIWQSTKCKFDGIPNDGNEYPNQNEPFAGIKRGKDVIDYNSNENYCLDGATTTGTITTTGTAHTSGNPGTTGASTTTGYTDPQDAILQDDMTSDPGSEDADSAAGLYFWLRSATF